MRYRTILVKHVANQLVVNDATEQTVNELFLTYGGKYALDFESTLKRLEDDPFYINK